MPKRRVLGREVAVARTRATRLLGLARIDRSDAGTGLLLERCRSIHTFGMRFALDVVFLDARMRPLALYRNVGRRRFVSRRGASHVVEFPARGAAR